MRVEIIDDAHQRFNGVNYHRVKSGYFISINSRLHRDVWTFHHGAIPKGYDIHHVDFDKANNQIENLQCLTRKEHRQLHCALHEPKQHELTCAVCGKSFLSGDKKRKRCPECLAEYKRQCEENRQAKLNPPPKAPKPPRTKICVVCGKEFELKPEQSLVHGRKTCSKECHDKICPPPLHDKPCVVCGKEIIHRPSEQPRFCSRDCLNRFMSVSRKGINLRNEKNPLTRA